MADLTRKQRDEIIQLLLPVMSDAQKAKKLLDAAFDHKPPRYQISLQGEPGVYIANMMTRLLDYGTLPASGEPALWALLKEVYAEVGKEDKESINALAPAFGVPPVGNPSSVQPSPPASHDVPPEEIWDMEIHIQALREDVYPVDITLNDERKFPGTIAGEIRDWQPTGNMETDGQTLFEMLFTERLRTAWDISHEWVNGGAGRRLRIRFWVDEEASELHAKPWEAMQTGHKILSIYEKTPFSRYLSSTASWLGAKQAPIRVLAVISNPGNLGSMNLASVNVEREKAILEKVFEGQDAFELRFLGVEEGDYATPDALVDELRAGCDVLHIVSHGAFNEASRSAYLYLQDEKGSYDRISHKRFAATLANREERPHLVFLTACESAVSAEGPELTEEQERRLRQTNSAFRGMGANLVAAGVPAVIAMQDVVTMETAEKFSSRFYRQLLRHGLVDLAANQARFSLFNAQREDAAVPVLYMRLKDGKLFEPEPAEDSPVIHVTPDSKPPPGAIALPGAPLPFEPVWLAVPAGAFLMGSDPDSRAAFDDEMPQHKLHLDEFFIAQTPVTNAHYKAYIQATGRPGPRHWQRGDDMPNHPVTYVNWRDAMEYCAWLTNTLRDAGRLPEGVRLEVRLPTEAQWEKAARGTDGRLYPWGDEKPDETRLNFNRNLDAPTPVGTYEMTSPYGCFDAAGNVWEWALSLERGYPYDPTDGREVTTVRGRRTLRGGAWNSAARNVRCAARNWSYPEERDGTIGFRVVLVRG